VLGTAVAVAMAGCEGARAGRLFDHWPSMPPAAVPVPAAGECMAVSSYSFFAFDNVDHEVRLVNCAFGGHELEVAYVGRFTGDAADRTIPPTNGGPDRYAAFGTCADHIRDYLGGDWYTAPLFVHIQLPNHVQWGAGARFYACTIAESTMDFGVARQRTGTLKGALAGATPMAITCVDVVGPRTADGFFDAESFAYVGCANAHNGEFVGPFAAPDNLSPGNRDQENRVVGDGCGRVAAAFLGVTEATLNKRTDMNVYWTGIYVHAWTLGSRTARCYLVTRADHPVHTSLKGLGQAGLPA
jgi:hypothetical protein